MNGNNGLSKGRSIIVLLLLVLMLALAATPALAWTPADEVDGQLLQGCRIVSDGSQLTIHYFGRGHTHRFAEKPLVRPNVAQTEIISVGVPSLAQVSAD
jgi:hypothetical protein